MIRALTLHRPWAWSVVAGHKPLENRSWPPPLNMIGEPLAIHAGRHWDEEGRRSILRLLCLEDLPKDDPLVEAEGVVGVVTVPRVVYAGAVADDMKPATLTDWELRWFTGLYGWVLRNVVRLAEPVPCRGYQKIWTLPTEVETEVVRQLAEIRR